MLKCIWRTTHIFSEIACKTQKMQVPKIESQSKRALVWYWCRNSRKSPTLYLLLIPHCRSYIALTLLLPLFWYFQVWITREVWLTWFMQSWKPVRKISALWQNMNLLPSLNKISLYYHDCLAEFSSNIFLFDFRFIW